MSTFRNSRVIACVVALCALTAACGDDDDDDATTATTAGGPAVAITSPADGTSVKGNVVTLDFDVRNFRIVKADGDTSGTTGHFHVFIDKEPVAAGETIDRVAGIVHSTEDPLKVTGLRPGSHTLTVVLGDGAHSRVGSAEDEVTVTVEGPSVDATAPATLAAGQPLSIEAVVDGVRLAAADGDRSGQTGHLHVFVDKEPTPAGQPVPVGDPAIIHSPTSPVAVTGLTPGEHTIWVALGDGAHYLFDPPVMDKLTVTVQ